MFRKARNGEYGGMDLAGEVRGIRAGGVASGDFLYIGKDVMETRLACWITDTSFGLGNTGNRENSLSFDSPDIGTGID